MRRRRTNVGKVYRSKRWAKRWAIGRTVRRVKGGWKICAGKVRTAAQQRAHLRKKARLRRRRLKRRRKSIFGLRF